MSSSIIIECSNNNADDIVSNAEYSCTTFPMTLNNGDVLNLKACIIDTDASDSGMIQILEDTLITMSFIIYDVPLSSTGKTITATQPGGGPNPDYFNILIGSYFIACNGVGNHPVERQQKTFTIKAGSYTPDFLAEEVTRGMSSLKYGYRPTATYYPNAYPLEFTVLSNYNEFEPHFTVRPPILLMSLRTDGTIDRTNYYYYNQKTPAYLGASQTVLSYNNNNSGRFSFDYIHTPLVDDKGNTIVVKMQSVYGNPLSTTLDIYVTKKTGILFTDLQPRSFWNTIGFSDDQIDNRMKATINQTAGLDSRIIFNDLTSSTGALLTNDHVLSYVAPSTNIEGLDSSNLLTFYTGLDYPCGNQVIHESDLTTPLYAEQNYFQTSDTPVFLVEISPVFNEYQDKDNVGHNISAIVSKVYSQNNYVTSYESDSIAYQHKGESLVISNIKVRILDIFTKQPVVDLGPNNFVFVQLIKQ